jgi:hypothetical protein
MWNASNVSDLMPSCLTVHQPQSGFWARNWGKFTHACLLPIFDSYWSEVE